MDIRTPLIPNPQPAVLMEPAQRPFHHPAYGRFKEWVKRGSVHARRVGSRKHLVIWADAEERERLCRLRDAFRPGQTNRYPVELTRPKARPDQG